MTDMTVANTILEQLGGRKFLVMTGAKNLIGDTNSLSFRLPRSKDGANVVKVILDPSDTYTVKTYSVRRVKGEFKHTPKTEIEGVYCDSLVQVFESTTGLATRLF